MEPAPDAASAADDAFDQVSEKISGGLQKAVGLEAELDNIAARIAAGTMPFKGYSAAIKQISRKTGLLGGSYSARAMTVPPGGTADLADFELMRGARHLAIGDAIGDLGRGKGYQYTVLIIVVAKDAN